MRGEDCPSAPSGSLGCGSPPHARGRQSAMQESFIDSRITPACAGKTLKRMMAANPGRDHPRMRGEDRMVERRFGESLGSPPHARGRHRRSCWTPEGFSITPACAGKTRRGHRPGDRCRDHPRMRGEDVGFAVVVGGFVGSPPHARGRPLARASDASSAGITPACAGKTPEGDLEREIFGDHPRMRGEDIHLNVKAVNEQGSPPHARGRRKRLPALS